MSSEPKYPQVQWSGGLGVATNKSSTKYSNANGYIQSPNSSKPPKLEKRYTYIADDKRKDERIGVIEKRCDLCAGWIGLGGNGKSDYSFQQHRGSKKCIHNQSNNVNEVKSTQRVQVASTVKTVPLQKKDEHGQRSADISPLSGLAGSGDKPARRTLEPFFKSYSKSTRTADPVASKAKVKEPVLAGFGPKASVSTVTNASAKTTPSQKFNLPSSSPPFLTLGLPPTKTTTNTPSGGRLVESTNTGELGLEGQPKPGIAKALIEVLKKRRRERFGDDYDHDPDTRQSTVLRHANKVVVVAATNGEKQRAVPIHSRFRRKGMGQ